MLWSILKTSYYPEPHSHISVEVTVVLYLSNYSNKKALDHATDVDTSDLAAKKDFIALKAEVDKLDINKLVLKKLSDVADNEVVRNKVQHTEIESKQIR